MRKRVVAIVIACCLVPVWQRPVAAAVQGNTVVLWLDHTTIDDWTRSGLTHFAHLLATGSSGLVWTLPAASRTDAVTLRARAARAMHIGAAVIGDADGRAIKDRLGTVQGAPSRVDSSFPDGRRTDVHATIEAARVTLAAKKDALIDFGDFARVERTLGTDTAARGPWIERSMASADAILGAVTKMLTPQDALIAIAPDTPVLRERANVRLGVFVATGPSFARGVIDGKPKGFLSLGDAAALIARTTAPRVSPLADPARFLKARDRGAVIVSRARPPLMAIALLLPCILIALLLVLMATGTRAEFARRAMRSLMVVSAFMPVSMVIGGNSNPSSTGRLLFFVIGRAVFSAVFARWLFGRRTMLFAMSATALYIFVDVISGAGLSAHSTLAVPLAAGARAPGLDAGVAGVTIGSALVAAGLLLDRRSANAVPVGITLVAIATVLGARGLGNQPGAVFALIPAAGLLIARAVARFDVRAVLATSSVTLAIASALALHGSKVNVGNALSARFDSLVHHLAGLWPVAIVLAVVPAVAFTSKKRDLAARATWGRPGTRAAHFSACIAAGISTFAIRGGLGTAAWILVCATMLIGTLLTEHQTS